MQQTMLISGGEGDLAQAIAALFLTRGWRVLAPSRADMDVASRESIEHFLEKSENAEHCELVIHAAGITKDAILSRQTEQDWAEVWQVHVQGARNLAAATKSPLHKNHGHLILLSSFSAWSPPLGQVAYASAKAALLGLTTDFARNWGSAGVRVNAILPGFLNTKMTKQVSELRRQQVLAQHTLGILNTCEHVAKFLYTLHQDLPCTSGQVFNLDSRLAER